jgi:hypothetical protein
MAEISDVILKTIKQYKMTPKEINDGSCDSFAWDVLDKAKKLGIRCSVKEGNFYGDYSGHFWIKCGNKVYDAETPYGVDRVYKLPIFSYLRKNPPIDVPKSFKKYLIPAHKDPLFRKIQWILIREKYYCLKKRMLIQDARKLAIEDYDKKFGSGYPNRKVIIPKWALQEIEMKHIRKLDDTRTRWNPLPVKKTAKKKGVVIPTGVIVVLTILAFTLPIFKSGGKDHLTFFEFIKNHTVWADPGPMFVPREDYEQIFNG